MNWYLIRLTPPRRNFASTMSADERDAMTRHVPTVALTSRPVERSSSVPVSP